MATLQSDLLLGLTPDEASDLLSKGTPMSLSAGQVLFDLGNPAHSVYIVTRGRLRLTLPIQVRGEERDILIEERTVGETVGWSGLIPPHRFTLKASAASDTDLTAFSRAVLQDHFDKHPAVAYQVTRNVGSVIGHRLQVFQTMWVREVQRAVEQRFS